jgi:hypothetical protein
VTAELSEPPVVDVDALLPVIGWAVVELLGHRREIGYLSVESIADAKFLRLETPGLDDADPTIRFFSTAAVYAITPTTERAVITEVESRRPWVLCGERFDAPGYPEGDTCDLRRGHDGAHEGLPF